MAVDFEKRFFDELDRRLVSFEEKLDDNTNKTEQVLQQALKTNGRVNRHDKELASITNQLAKITAKRLQIPQIDPRTLYFLAVAAVIFLLIIAGIMGVDVKGFL